MRDCRIYLKVKIKSLAAEAKIIRFEEQKAREHRNRDLRIGLAGHRRGVVRHEARHSLLAYGFLRGLPYERMEAKCHEKPDWPKVRKMVEKYGVARDWDEESRVDFEKRLKEQMEAFDKWRTDGFTG